jgi:AraC-like DNA-binding protein
MTFICHQTLAELPFVRLVTDLLIEQARIAPGQEWADRVTGWTVLRINKGAFYWLSHGKGLELNPGDVLVVSPDTEGILRASIIGDGSLEYFNFRPEHLVGLISVSERLAFQELGAKGYVRTFPAEDRVAREFAAVAEQQSPRRGFLHRSRLLSIVALILAEALPATRAPASHVMTSELRFDQLVQQIPDSELIRHSSEKLAELCGCSARHFRRLFRKRFHTSIRAKQTELRLDRARELLVNTDEKIITVAVECGYRHLGLFNSLFKKRFGVTPSEWRRNARATLQEPGASLEPAKANYGGRKLPIS